jgi:hypothetical protein
VGRPDAEIVTQAEEIGAGLIVVGSRGLGASGRSLMGGVSESVVRHAHCPVLVVRGEPVVLPTKVLLAVVFHSRMTLFRSKRALLLQVLPLLLSPLCA